MTTSFRTPYIVVQRYSGEWRDGHYYPETDGIPKNVMMTIQVPSDAERNGAIEMYNYGGRASRFIKCYTDTKLNAMSQQPGGHPGDIILFEGRNFVIIGELNFNQLKKTRTTRVAHWRYFAAEIVEEGASAGPHELA